MRFEMLRLHVYYHFNICILAVLFEVYAGHCPSRCSTQRPYMQVGAVADGIQLGCRCSVRVKWHCLSAAAGPQLRTMHNGPTLS